MTVKTILCRKGRDVVTIEPSATLESAIATLAEHRIGALVVLGAEQRVVGILSERDVVRTFAEFGADALTKRLAHDTRGRDLWRGRYGRRHYGVDDQGQVPTHSGGRAGPAGRHRVDR
jgi:CBS domain-containing protein